VRKSGDDFIFQQDGAPAHAANTTQEWLGQHHRDKYIFYLESIRPIRTAENFEAVEWATGFSNKNGCIVGLIDTTAPVLASQAEAIVDLGRTWPQHRIDIH